MDLEFILRIYPRFYRGDRFMNVEKWFDLDRSVIFLEN